jgi:hypothetical protein
MYMDQPSKDATPKNNMEFNFPLMAHLAWFEVGAILQEIVWSNAIVEPPFWIQLL